MADTQRDTASILALLADNTGGDISPQDLRDAIVSILGGYGGLTADGSAAQLTGIFTATLVTGFTHAMATDGTVVTASVGDDDVTMSVAAKYEVHASLSFTGSASATYTILVYLNGVATAIKAQGAMDSSGGALCLACSGVLDIPAGQAIDLRITSTLADSVALLRGGQLWAKRVS